MLNKLDRRITIQSATEVQDAQGTAVKTWATYATRWAKIESVTSDTGENYSADTKVAIRGVDWIVRNDTTTKNITEKMRVVYESKYYDIDSIQEVTDYRRKGFLVIHSVKRGSIDESN